MSDGTKHEIWTSIIERPEQTTLNDKPHPLLIQNAVSSNVIEEEVAKPTTNTIEMRLLENQAEPKHQYGKNGGSCLIEEETLQSYHVKLSMPRETLVMTHGLGGASCHFALVLPELTKHYRVIFFDNMCFGNNPRDESFNIDRSKSENVDEWIIEYWEKWVEKVGLGN